MTADPQAGVRAPGGRDRFLGLLSEEAPAGQAGREEDEDRSYARDLNLDQIVAAVAGDR